MLSTCAISGVNSLRPRQNGCLFADDTFKRIFLNENIRISTENSPKFVPNGLINNIPALVQIMSWRRPGDKPLSEPMMVSLSTHICITRPQWVKQSKTGLDNCIDPVDLGNKKLLGQQDFQPWLAKRTTWNLPIVLISLFVIGGFIYATRTINLMVTLPTQQQDFTRC